MSDTSDSNGGRRGSIFGPLRDVIDFVQVAAVVGIAVMVYVQPKPPGSDNDKDKECRSSIVIGLLSGIASRLIPPELMTIVEKHVNKCEHDPDVRYVMNAVSEAARDPRLAEAASPTTLALGTLKPISKSFTAEELAFGKAVLASETGTAPAAPSAGPISAAPTKAATSGWVAVGFVGDETLFGLPPGRTLQTLMAGDELTAKRPVNLRKKAADWTGPIGVVAAERKVKIVEAPKSLPAGSLTQVWARVELP